MLFYQLQYNLLFSPLGIFLSIQDLVQFATTPSDPHQAEPNIYSYVAPLNNLL